MHELEARSWAEALELLYVDSWQHELNRYRSTFAFRGVGRDDGSLRPSLRRIGDEPSLEQHLLRNFRKYATERPEQRFDSIWHWLALGQHHGLPTRLLDWTYSPLVALHFATEHADLFHEPAVVWAIDYVAAKRLLPRALQDALDDEMCDVFTPELLGDTVASLEELRELGDTPALIFMEPPSLDQRIVTQYALFSFLTHPDAELAEWASTHADLCRRVTIAPDAKREIRDKLDQANITERVLYPGLDGLCRWLKRYYEARR